MLLKYIPNDQFNNKQVFHQEMAWHPAVDKSLSEPMMSKFIATCNVVMQHKHMCKQRVVIWTIA